ncbi:cytochrome P450 [Halosimplex litoreum]|uniref:Cytochrome P450 n=1 Tax=Halosimplex litoreum TaxID=1198301 RepID=A0A7T3KWC8_9EURY|nr:cytochrome P450 [Halosimplex litoreum]QPV64014.1 cytochrome P450 [Halosimplex litoreum]
MSETAGGPPTPDGVPVLGNGWAFARDPVGALSSWGNLGDIVRIEMPGREMYVVYAPSAIARVLRDDHDRFTIGPAQRELFSGVEDHAVTTTAGERWERLRRELAPAFSRERVRTYGDRMVAATERYAETWDVGERLDLTTEMRRLAVTILGDALLATDLRGQTDRAMAAADALVARANFRRPGLALPGWVPTPTDWRFDRAVGALDDQVEALLADRRGSDANDACAVLLAAHERGALSMAEVRHNVVAFLLAGHESPAAALSLALWLLDEHPEAATAVRDEYDAVADGDGLDGADFAALPETRAVVRETLRLYPPTTGVNRQAGEPVTLAGYDLPAGSQILMPQRPVHRDERFWDDPGSFDPGRWSRDVERPDFAYFPFSGGPRRCIGDEFARRELVLALATLVGRVEMEVHMDGPLAFTPSIQLRPTTDIHATVRPRP